MTTVFCHFDLATLPDRTVNVFPVLLYGITDPNLHASIGNAALPALRRLPTKPSIQSFDFLSIALAVTAADTFVDRGDAPDRWCRDLKLVISLCDPTPWVSVKAELELALRFLTGDLWTLEFRPGGSPPPEINERRTKLTIDIPRSTDSIALFSGGLDSTIGAFDLLARGKNPLLVSHAYRGDSCIQRNVLQHMPRQIVRLGANLHPVNLRDTSSDITMRSRSFNFLALAAVAASVVAEVTDTNLVPLIVPENGFIALNAPLTPRRVGSLSTRTTHPYFLGKIQNVFDQIGIPATISNPYEFKTKGEMFRECLNPLALQSAAPQTMSCSNWKRKGHACGRCVPCLIRRASFEFAGVADTSIYAEPLTQGAEMGDDLLAVLTAILRARETPTRAIASRSGPLPLDPHLRSQYEGVVRRGLDEMECFLLARGIA
jgi:7-cyano-7-deazaguanine synthase in queuosine biosynthesis